jgi:hypothetical protein
MRVPAADEFGETGLGAPVELNWSMIVQNTPEPQILAESIVLGLMRVVAASHSASVQHGCRWAAGRAMSPRRR